ncbi:MAG: AAA family ATPase [Prevotellaceae bacterium]|jgi:predicted ATP-binding protein involved in virulence|nr:AAA family ATPase [Prevotellaceae bacterium]
MLTPKNIAAYVQKAVVVDFKGFKGRHKFSFVDERGACCQWTVFLGNNNTGKTNLLKAIASLELLKNIHGYGVVRTIKSQGIASDNAKTLYADNLLNNGKLINFEDWLFQLDYAAKNEQQRATSRLALLKSVLISDIFPELSDIRFVSDEKLSNYIEFKTKDGWHKPAELGYGYQATLSWMCDFCKRMFDRYPNSEQPLREPAVLLVDELDLHLHPQWQRTIIKYLSDIFPATQFIVTTHSPFIIQSMQRVNLYTLQLEGDHTLVRHYGMRSFLGWRIEEILGEIMGLENNIQTDTYQTLMKQFNDALSEENYEKGKQAYDELMKILHPQSTERKLLDIQLSQLIPDDKA